MANSPQAIKRARQIEKCTLHNQSQKSAMRTMIKKTEKLIGANDKTAAQTALKTATAAIDKLAGRGVIHQNTSARLKSRLNKRVHKMQD
ncbi:MAG: 30S ribosomal protein S20 [Gammaproteobacteria bacterium]|nr:30S ribosomal protein S20 [Gammaproteobacteria bacterium]